MSLLLLFFVVVAAGNPGRIAVAAPAERDTAVWAIGGASVLLLWSGVLLAWLSGPLLGRFDVSASSSMIAAGIAVLVIGTRDALVAPPELQIMMSWRRAAAFPLFFPTLFTPGLALTAVAAGAERGVWSTALALSAGISVSAALAVAMTRSPSHSNRRATRLLASAFGLWAVAAGTILAVRGVRSI